MKYVNRTIKVKECSVYMKRDNDIKYIKTLVPASMSKSNIEEHCMSMLSDDEEYITYKVDKEYTAEYRMLTSEFIERGERILK